MTATVIPGAATSSPLRRRLRAVLGPTPVPWGTVTALAVLLAGADAFVLVAVQGAVGAIERSQDPFLFWLQVLALTLPVFFLAVLGALAVARRRLRPSLHAFRRVVAAALMVVAAATLVGTAELGISAARDYQLQSELVQIQHANHNSANGGAATHIDPAVAARESLRVDILGARIGAGLDLAANVVLVGWVVALRGGRLDWVPRRRRPAGD